MKEKKSIKRLQLKKEEIVNLNDFQMNQIKGGASPSAIAYSIYKVSEVVSLTYSLYDMGHEFSLWNCEKSKQENCMGDISVYKMSGGCLIPEVNVYGLYTYGG